MKETRTMAPALQALLASVFVLFVMPVCAGAAADLEEFLPPVTCGSGWKLEGKPAFYDRHTLSNLIDGEAELYFPYGFDRLAYARYIPEKPADAGMDVHIYRMGSVLDAFGMYANYRRKEGRAISAGTESSLSDSQLFLYQGRYFVQIQVTGAVTADPEVLAGCAGSVTARLKGDGKRPPELSVFERPEVVKGSERYLPQSLLGYDFFNRGIMADALVGGTHLQVFLLLGTTPEAASAAFERYRSQIMRATAEAAGKSSVYLEGVDPLYGPVIVLRRGGCLAGAIKFTDKGEVRRFLENVCR